MARASLVTPLALAVNDYELLSAGQVCPESQRLPLACGMCGPNWGSLQDCEDQCNSLESCSHITYFDDLGCRVYSGCDVAKASAAVGTEIYHRKSPKPVTRDDGPCDIYGAAGFPCVAAHSVVRALYANYTGHLYRLLRDSDKAGLDVPVTSLGFADMRVHEQFCSGTDCFVVRIFDQSPQGNDLDTAPPGGACRPAGGAGLKPVNASRERVSLGGHSLYGAFFEGGQGYRNDRTSGVATGEQPQTMYMVTRGDHYNGGCCFDYGNAETNDLDDGEGTMEALYFGSSTAWGHGQGEGPWVMADLENGLFAGDEKVAPAPSLRHQFVTALAKGRKEGFALKGGDAQQGKLQVLHDGNRPKGYEVMKKQGAIILGIGGDASCGAVGTFYEGAMTASYTTDEADDAVQANVVAVGYSALTTVLV